MDLDSKNNFSEEEKLNSFTWKEIKDNKKWIVINGYVYDVSNFMRKHPGGSRILTHVLGEDASDAYKAFHNDVERSNKYLKGLKIGKVAAESKCEDSVKEEITKDFRRIRDLAEQMNLYKTNFSFFALHFLQLIVYEVIAVLLLNYFGFKNWYAYMAAVALLVTEQAQAGWLQHDLGHLSVFKSTSMNHFAHRFVINFIKGASADWWNHRHFRHHAKPNIISKDPDIGFDGLFVLGKIVPKEEAKKKLGFFNFHYQHIYFYFLFPPLLLPIYFFYDNLYFIYKKKNLKDFLWFLTFFVRWYIIFGSILGGWGAIKLFFLVRFFESYWFSFVTQMNHIVMDIDHEHELDWLRLQSLSTCNVEPSFFNDWFTGHLNYQIEHHLFPRMPRHNYHKIAPYIKSLCQKYDIPYIIKPIGTAMGDIYSTLKESGQLWYDSYNHF